MNIPDGTVVRVINKGLNTYNKILVVDCKKYFQRYICVDLKGYVYPYYFNYYELEILPTNCNFFNNICIFCGSRNKSFKIKNIKRLYYCPKCLR